ncbi:uncharacterized protein LOC122254681 isoform X2 [Penaeus japonicus]|uniref:uncharacterized protein LOC122254681 isoform X2 n=1 Tax=Penaeus japonicus TaxID=27405 RepID=UPI001C70D5C3|nr:uncharacterized protein LOC122254681 isoform X2 [Penaeus japonicus]
MRTGTLLLVAALALSAAAQDENPTEEKATATDVPYTYSTFPPSNCRYYCGYDGDAYCCDDGTRPLPEDHDDNPGGCVEMEQHICESDAIFYNSSSGTKQLFSGSPVATPPCASDGYCAEDEKCCPTPCARKHLCLAATAEKNVTVKNKPAVTDVPNTHSTFPPSNCRYYCGYDGDAYCCDDGTRPIPEDHDDNPGGCVEMEEHICESDAIFYNSSSGTKQLFSGSPVDTPPCASDGYCAEDEKCCPTPCARKHLCLAATAEKGVLVEETPTKTDCRYYCGYDGDVYCCDDGTRPLPQDHYDHPGACVAMEEHVCKKDVIYYNSVDWTGKSTMKKLFTGSPVDTPPCASDGYCAEDEKCCPTPCAKKHLCLKFEYYSCRYYCFWGNVTYCCDDGTLIEPKDHDDHEGVCPEIDEEDCGDKEVPIKAAGNGGKKKYTFCASDGYCTSSEKCCPSKCAERHACLKANRVVEEIDDNGVGGEEIEF